MLRGGPGFPVPAGSDEWLAGVLKTLPIGRLARPDEVAETVLWLLSDQAELRDRRHHRRLRRSRHPLVRGVSEDPPDFPPSEARASPRPEREDQPLAVRTPVAPDYAVRSGQVVEGLQPRTSRARAQS